MSAKKKAISKTNSPQPGSDAALSKPIASKPKTPPKTNDANQMLVKSNLRQLRLPTMNAEFEKLAREAAESNETYQDYLLRLTELEVAARSSNALNSRIKHASFPVQKDLDTYDFSALPSVNKQKVFVGRSRLRMRFCCVANGAEAPNRPPMAAGAFSLRMDFRTT